MIFCELIFLRFVGQTSGGIEWYLLFFFSREVKFHRECKYKIKYEDLDIIIERGKKANKEIQNLLKSQEDELCNFSINLVDLENYINKTHYVHKVIFKCLDNVDFIFINWDVFSLLFFLS